MLRKVAMASIVFGLVVGIGTAATAQEAACDEAMVRTNIQRVIDEGFNQGNSAVVDELFTEDFMTHPDDLDRAGFTEQMTALRTAMPSSAAHIDHLLVEGCDAFFIFHQGGSMEGDLTFPGQEPIPASGSDLHIDAHVYLRFNEAGQVAEQWDFTDSLPLLTQTGLMPAGEAPMAEATAEATVEAGMDETITTGGNEARNIETVHQAFEQGFNTGDTEFLRGLYAPDFMGRGSDDSVQSVDQLLDSINSIRSAFPDANITINDTVAQGDYVATRVTVSGTFQNAVTMPDGQTMEPTGGPVSYEASFLHRLTPEGLIVEDWEIFDQLDFMSQMGMTAPGMEATAEAGMEATAEATAESG
jgi:predicted ester cyclase